MQTDVRSAIADILKREGVEYAFGHTGGHIRSLWKAISDIGITTIFNKQEGNAVYMADAYAKISGKLPVILGTSGPGVENMVAATSSAFLDSTPMIIFGAMVPTFAVGKNALQDSSGRGRAVEQRLIFKACTKQAMLAPTPASIPDMVREAFRVALSGKQGPVYIEIPSDFWNATINYEVQEPSTYKNLALAECSQEKAEEIYQKISAAKRPLIIVGEGALEKNIRDTLQKFIEKAGVPFATTPLTKSIVDEYHPLYLGTLRGTPSDSTPVYKYMTEADCILLLGARMNQWEAGWDYQRQKLFPKAELLQVDSDPEEIGRVFAVQQSIVGSIFSFLQKIEVKTHSQSNVLAKKVQDLHTHELAVYQDEKGINPRNLNNIVNRLVDENAVIVTDTGYAGSMSLNFFKTKAKQLFISSDRNSPMGYGIPAALGAALIRPQDTVVCFVGDGSFQMSCNEFGLLMDHQLKVIFIVENNGACKMIEAGNLAEYGETCVTDFNNPDYTKLAEAYGMLGMTADNSTDFEAAFKQALASKKSVIIDAKIDQESMVWE